jgi:hypothetical protein
VVLRVLSRDLERREVLLLRQRYSHPPAGPVAGPRTRNHKHSCDRGVPYCHSYGQEGSSEGERDATSRPATRLLGQGRALISAASKSSGSNSRKAGVRDGRPEQDARFRGRRRKGLGPSGRPLTRMPPKRESQVPVSATSIQPEANLNRRRVRNRVHMISRWLELVSLRSVRSGGIQTEPSWLN